MPLPAPSRESVRQEGPGSGGRWAVALTRKLLSLGLEARLRPRRMLSFRSDTLDRVTLPVVGGRSSACSLLLPALCPEPAAVTRHQRGQWQDGAGQSPSRFLLPLWAPCLHVVPALHGLLRPYPDTVSSFPHHPCEMSKLSLREAKQSAQGHTVSTGQSLPSPSPQAFLLQAICYQNLPVPCPTLSGPGSLLI